MTRKTEILEKEFWHIYDSGNNPASQSYLKYFLIINDLTLFVTEPKKGSKTQQKYTVTSM